nr:TPA_asm: VP [Tasmanian devil feces monodnaparvovirus 2]
MGHLKRKSEEPHVGTKYTAVAGSSAAEKQASGDGGEGGADESPIPRGPSTKSLCMCFYQRSWEEISSQKLSYLPQSLTPLSFFDGQQLQIIDKMLDAGFLFEIEHMGIKISNFIVLNDQLAASGDTPQEISSVVQRAKIVQFTPNIPMTTAFQIYDKQKRLSYKIDEQEQPNRDYFRHADITSFENLEIKGMPSMIVNKNTNFQGGLSNSNIYDVSNYRDFIGEGGASTADDEPYYTQNYSERYGPYLGLEKHPREMFHNDKGKPIWRNALGALIGIFDSGESYRNSEIPTITYVKNQHGFSILSPSDVIKKEINTNMKGKVIEKTMHTITNDELTHHHLFTHRGVVADGTGNLHTTIPVYPSTLNPLIKKEEFIRGARAYSHKPKPIQHMFFTMIPINEANGAVMKQRANCFFEQKMVIKFYYNEMVDVMDSGVTTETSFPLSPYVWRSRALPKNDSVFDTFYI